MRKRDAASAPNVGDRVAYVMIQAAKNSKGFEKSEDPLYALQNNLPIDYQFYLEHQLKQPLVRIFEPILKDKVEQILFAGDHMRNIYKPAMSNSNIGLFKFTKVRETCLGCHNVLSGNQQVVCKNCEGRMREIYI